VKNPASLASLLCLALPLAAYAGGVTTYHAGPSRHADYVLPNLTTANAAEMHLDSAFNAPITGAVYAQPLVWQSASVPKGEVIAASESNIVTALNPATGAILWQTTLGTPVPHSDLPCGNIDPEGITGTPALDPASGTIYANALIDTASGPRHQIFALDPTTGAILPNWPLDIGTAANAAGQNFDSTLEGQRSALLFLNGALYVSYGGRAGDCGAYHGIVAEIATAGTPTLTGFWSTTAEKGGIWSQGGPFTDGRSLYVTTGNTKGATTWGDGEAIIRLAPGLAHSTDPKNYFTPANWPTLDDDDADLGGTDATFLKTPGPGGTSVSRLLALGKDGNAYLVNPVNLGGIGGQIATVAVSASEIVTAPATYTTPTQALVAFYNRKDLVCGRSAITMLSVTATSVSQLWCAPQVGGGAPILTTTDGTHNPIVWAIGAGGDQLLHGYDALTGAVVFNGGGTANALANTRHFATITAWGGKFYVAGDNRIYAFDF
jgi:outer membrane protein assembly factor BamB